MAQQGRKRVAVVLFNLGGPDSLAAVRPFLFNLFNDKAIVAAPGPVRWMIARLISGLRAKSACANYAKMGGASPLLQWTEQQAAALEAALAVDTGDYKCFIAMRYWRPFIQDAAAAVKTYQPDLIVLLPLYPQFSTTTTGSSLAEWRKAAAAQEITALTKTVCCYPAQDDFIDAHASIIDRTLSKADPMQPVRILFSAHGLPKKVIEAGDPYQAQVEATCAAVAEKLKVAHGRDDLDWTICYQSRVGPLEWIGPSTDEEIIRAAGDDVGVLVAPVAFVSEHIETLVELDEEYAELAQEKGVSIYLRAPALGLEPAFIAGLAKAVRQAEEQGPLAPADQGTKWRCPAAAQHCPFREAAA